MTTANNSTDAFGEKVRQAQVDELRAKTLEFKGYLTDALGPHLGQWREHQFQGESFWEYGWSLDEKAESLWLSISKHNPGSHDFLVDLHKYLAENDLAIKFISEEQQDGATNTRWTKTTCHLIKGTDVFQRTVDAHTSNMILLDELQRRKAKEAEEQFAARRQATAAKWKEAGQVVLAILGLALLAALMINVDGFLGLE